MLSQQQLQFLPSSFKPNITPYYNRLLRVIDTYSIFNTDKLIKQFWGNMSSGAYRGEPLWDYDDDFTGADNWVDNDSTKIGVDTTNDELDTHFDLDSTNDSSVYDLQNVLGAGNFAGTQWIMRIHTWNFSTITASGSNGWWVGLSDLDQTASRSTAQDFLGGAVLHDGTNSTIDAQVKDNAGLTLPAGTVVSWATATNYYIEIVRDGDNLTVKVSTNSDFSSPITDSTTGANAVSNLRYICLRNIQNSTEAGEFIGTLQRVQFQNDQTTPP